MKRCKKCGCTEFTAHQRLYTDIIVDGDNNFLQNNSMDDSISVYEHENPYGHTNVDSVERCMKIYMICLKLMRRTKKSV